MPTDTIAEPIPPKQETARRSGKRVRECALDERDCRLSKCRTSAWPRDETSDPPFPGTVWHPPIAYLKHSIYIEVPGTSRARWVVKPHWQNPPRKYFGLRAEPERMWANVIAFCEQPSPK